MLLIDFDLWSDELTKRLTSINEPKRKNAWSLAQIQVDHLVRDFAIHSDLYHDDAAIKIHDANKILTYSPDCPFAMAMLVESDWEHAQADLAEWEKKAADSPALIAALGRRYSELKQYDKAREFLDRYILEAPESWAYERLAKLQGTGRHRTLARDSRQVPGRGRRPRPGQGQGPRRDRQPLHESARMDQGAALCRRGGGDLGAVGDELHRGLPRGVEGMGAG